VTEALQLALDSITEAAGPDSASQLIAAKCRGLMRGYDARWSNSEYEIEAIEDTVQSDLWNPESQRKSRTFRIAGKIDVKARYRGRRVIWDHKTTSDEIADPASPFWRQLVIEGQASMYALLEWLNARKVDDIVWDVVRKPSIAPKALSKKDLVMIGIGRSYFGFTVSDEGIAEAQRTERENAELYEARLAQDCTVERPERYFQRRSIPRLDSEIHEFATELWEHSQEIIHARATDRHTRNPGACMAFHRPCSFLGICSGYDTPDSDNWQKKAQVHSELPLLNGDGRDVLTVSRVKEFQLCRKRHFYKYEMGIERQDEEDAEALRFGSLWHIGLEAYLGAFIQKEQYDDSNGNAEGSELAATGQRHAN
jgi:hypothetical protein